MQEDRHNAQRNVIVNRIKTKRGEEIEIKRFLKIFKDVIKDNLSGETLQALLNCICDDDMKIVKYEKFNKLCDLYFYLPGNCKAKKNDSENLYLIMSSMAHNKASTLYQKVSIPKIFLKFMFCRRKNT